MKVLITGGAGFIGSHLAQKLCSNGVQVTVVDNFRTGDLNNLAWAKAEDHLRVVEADITDSPVLESIVAESDWVFHLAAEASVPFSVSHPLEAHQVNLEAAFRLLVTCREAGVKRFVFASSSAIYGDAGSEPVSEDQQIAPLSPYGLQKYAVETYVRQF